MRIALLWSALLMAGCSSSSSERTCKQVLDGVFSVVGPEFANEPAELNDKPVTVIERMIGRCEHDKWPAAARSCLAAAKDDGAIKRCWYKHLSGTRTPWGTHCLSTGEACAD